MEATLINILGVEGFENLSIWISNHPFVPMLVVIALAAIAFIIIGLVVAFVHDLIVTIINLVNHRMNRKLFRFSEDH